MTTFQELTHAVQDLLQAALYLQEEMINKVTDFPGLTQNVLDLLQGAVETQQKKCELYQKKHEALRDELGPKEFDRIEDLYKEEPHRLNEKEFQSLLTIGNPKVLRAFNQEVLEKLSSTRQLVKKTHEPINQEFIRSLQKTHVLIEKAKIRLKEIGETK